MEQPLRRNQFDMNTPFEGDAGAMKSNRGEVSRQAGHILLHESPHGGEISLNPNQPQEATQPTRTELTAWHNIQFDAKDHVVDQSYGSEFYNEQKAEQVGDGGVSALARSQAQHQAAAQAASQPTDPATPAHAAPVVPVPQLTTPLTTSNPIYNAMSHPLSAQQPQPIDQPVQPQQPEQPHVPPQATFTPPVPPAQPEHQQLSQEPLGGPQAYGPIPQQPVQLAGAVNPSFAPQAQQPPMPPERPALPTAPQYNDPRLPEGTPKRVDPQHLLPVARHHALAILKNPWVWLAAGLLMIFYFVRSM